MRAIATSVAVAACAAQGACTPPIAANPETTLFCVDDRAKSGDEKDIVKIGESSISWEWPDLGAGFEAGLRTEQFSIVQKNDSIIRAVESGKPSEVAA